MSSVLKTWFYISETSLFSQLPLQSGEGLETAIVHTWPWPPWITLLFLMAASAYVGYFYIRERGSANRILKSTLAVLRIALIGLTVFMLYGWMQHRHRTDLPDLVVILDVSSSMAHVDHYDQEKLLSEITLRLQASELDEATRINLAKSLLLEPNSALLQSLQEKYHLKIYLIGASARIQASDRDLLRANLRQVKAEDSASLLGMGLRDVLQSQRGRPTAAAILLTDGVSTEGVPLSEAAELARRRGIPLYIIGLGNEKTPRDIRVSDLLVDEVVFLNDWVHFDFKLSAEGFENQEVQVRLKKPGSNDILAEQKIALPLSSPQQSVRLSFRPQEKGDFEYLIEAQPLQGEIDKQNNRQSRLVSVRDETLKVLMVQEYPNWEFRALKTMLGRSLKSDAPDAEKAIQLTTVLQDADIDYAESDENARRIFPIQREELFQYDVLIFGDVNRSHLSQSVMQNISDFVKIRGGGIIFIAGPRHTPLAYRDTPIADLFPIKLDTASVPDSFAALAEPFSIQLTPLGRSSPQTQVAENTGDNQLVWQSFPGMYWNLDSPDIKAAARVLAVHATRTGPSGKPLPMISMQFVGAGKVVFHSMDETWIWRAHGDDTYWNRYWMQTIRYLSRSKLLSNDRAVELTSDRRQYRQGDAVRLRVRFFDERLAPPQDNGVSIILEREGGKRRSIGFQRKPSSRGVFEATVANLTEGSYRAWIAAPLMEGVPPGQRFNIVAPPGELAKLAMDAADLQQAAKTSKGRFYRYHEVSRLSNDLPRGRQVRIDSLPSLPIWNSPFLALLFVVLIVSEWLLRKKAGLV